MKKQTKIKSKGGRQLISNIVGVALVGGLSIMLVSINNNRDKTVAVVRAKENIYNNQLIGNSSIERYDMPFNEFNNSGNKYLKWSDKDECINKYSTVQTKQGLYIIQGDYSETRPAKNAWLSSKDDGQIYVTIPYDKSSSFGNILVPGDYLRVNIAYSTDEESLDANGFAISSSKMKNDDLFNKIQIVDLLNSAGNSIYNYYNDLLAMSQEDRENKLADESFLNSVTPTQIVLSVTSEEDFKKYTQLKAYPSIKYTYGLYPRDEDDTILEGFKSVSSDINKALEDKEGGIEN